MPAAPLTTGTVTGEPIGVEPARIVNVSVPCVDQAVGAGDRGAGRSTVCAADGAEGIAGGGGGRRRGRRVDRHGVAERRAMPR